MIGQELTAAVRELQAAMWAEDSEALGLLIDFEALRASILAQIRANNIKTFHKRYQDAARISHALEMADKLTEAIAAPMLTPEGLLKLIRNAFKPAMERKTEREMVKYRIQDGKAIVRVGLSGGEAVFTRQEDKWRMTGIAI